jgi:large subunit ribosomal protein L9
MPSGPLKTVGEHTVTVAPSGDVVATIKIVVVAEPT